MLTKRCCDCRQAKRVELFDIDSRKVGGRSAQYKDCRRQRQNRGGYSTSRNRALAELARRHRADRQHHCQQVRAAHPDWLTPTIVCVATNQHRRAHRAEFLKLVAAHAGAKPAGPELSAKINRRALRLLQLAYPEEYQALYAAEQARISSSLRGFTKP
jgi:hypothetical protein